MLPSTFAKATVDRISSVASFQFSMPMWNGEALGVGWRLEFGRFGRY